MRSCFLLQQNDEYCIHRQPCRAAVLKPTGVIMQKGRKTYLSPLQSPQLLSNWLKMGGGDYIRPHTTLPSLVHNLEKWWRSGEGVNCTGGVTWFINACPYQTRRVDECKMAQTRWFAYRTKDDAFKDNIFTQNSGPLITPTAKIGAVVGFSKQMKILQNMSKILQYDPLTSGLNCPCHQDFRRKFALNALAMYCAPPVFTKIYHDRADTITRFAEKEKMRNSQ